MFSIIITMAGRGQRFLDAGFAQPKYSIKAHGQSLFAWSILSLKRFFSEQNKFIFVVREEDRARRFIQQECQKFGLNNISIVELKSETNGQATTVLQASPVLENYNNYTLIYNIDTHANPKMIKPEAIRGDGWLPCFPGMGDKWSFVKCNPGGQAVEVREKKRISPHATIGLYGFRSFKLYADLYQEHFSNGSGVECSEYYIAPMYNTLISRGLDVFIHPLDVHDVIPLGTPKDFWCFNQSTQFLNTA